MARPPRTTAPQTLYHVWVRATGGGRLFIDLDDRERLLRLVAYTAEKYGWLVRAYAQLSTHHHLLVFTEVDNLSRAMQLLSGVYAQTFNRRHGRTGHLVSSRFGSKVVESEEHAKELCRYIVLNPVRAGVAARPEHWMWSSYRATIGLAAAPPHLDVGWVLDLFGDEPEADAIHFRRFVQAGLDLDAGGLGSDPDPQWRRP
jgi:putative transposase